MKLREEQKFHWANNKIQINNVIIIAYLQTGIQQLIEVQSQIAIVLQFKAISPKDDLYMMFVYLYWKSKHSLIGLYPENFLMHSQCNSIIKFNTDMRFVL